MRRWLMRFRWMAAVFLLLAVGGDLASRPGPAQLPPAASASPASAPTSPADAAPVVATLAVGCAPACTSVIVNQGAAAKSESSSILSSLASSAQTFGLFAAGLFFSWKLLTGYQAVNMDVVLELRRQPLNQLFDYLVIGVSLKKGDREASRVKRMALTIHPVLVEAAPRRAPFNVNMQADVLVAWDPSERDFPVPVEDRPFVTPGETARFEKVVKVARDETVLVAAQVLADSGFIGRYRFLKKLEAKWRTTAVSTPADRSERPS